MQKILKNKKGSISLFVLVSSLFFLVIVTTIVVNLKTKESGINSKYDKVKASYEKDIENEEAIYQDKITKTVTFNPNGGTLNTTTKQVKIGQTYGELPTPTKEGYTFKGWNGKNLLNPDAEYAKRYDGTVNREYIKFDENTGIYTSYTNNHHHVYGYDVMNSITKGNTYTFSVNIEENGSDSSAHAGFDTMDNGERKVYYNNIVTEVGKRLSYTHTISQGVTSCIVGINNNGDGTGVKYSKLQLEEGSEATEYEPYYVTAETTVTQTKDHTLTAIWEEN